MIDSLYAWMVEDLETGTQGIIQVPTDEGNKPLLCMDLAAAANVAKNAYFVAGRCGGGEPKLIKYSSACEIDLDGNPIVDAEEIEAAEVMPEEIA